MMRILKSLHNQTMIYQNGLENMFGKNNTLIHRYSFLFKINVLKKLLVPKTFILFHFFNLSVMKFLENMSGNKTEMEWLEGFDKMLGINITSVFGEFKNIDIIQNDFQCLMPGSGNTKCGNLTVPLR